MRFPDALTCVLSCLLVFMMLDACQLPPGTDGRAAGGESTSGPSYGRVFLDRGECSSRGPDPREVPCSGERAAAQVLARHSGGRESGATCPAATDFILRISEDRPSDDEDGDGAVARGYACMRNLQPPHPGDPGGGGGPHTVIGDCLYSSRAGEVKETACPRAGDGTREGMRKPQFRLFTAVAERSLCPPSTAMYVRLDSLAGDKPVGCARRL